MCFLVELPPQERHKFDNILLTGLWYGKSKPNVPVFPKHFVNELSDLANGTDFDRRKAHNKRINTLSRLIHAGERLRNL